MVIAEIGRFIKVKLKIVVATEDGIEIRKIDARKATDEGVELIIRGKAAVEVYDGTAWRMWISIARALAFVAAVVIVELGLVDDDYKVAERVVAAWPAEVDGHLEPSQHGASLQDIRSVKTHTVC